MLLSKYYSNPLYFNVVERQSNLMFCSQAAAFYETALFRLIHYHAIIMKPHENIYSESCHS